jgi:hypothetical protein
MGLVHLRQLTSARDTQSPDSLAKEEASSSYEHGRIVCQHVAVVFLEDEPTRVHL